MKSTRARVLSASFVPKLRTDAIIVNWERDEAPDSKVAMQVKPKRSRFRSWEKILGWCWVLFTTALAHAGMDNVLVACKMQRLRNSSKKMHVSTGLPLFFFSYANINHVSIKRPTSGGQARNQEAAIQQTFTL